MRGFIEELRHRNVIRVGIAYVIAGWLIAQVADLASDAFRAPAWFMQMLIVMLLIGLPIALFLAWAYELTPDGVIKAEDVPIDTPKDPRSGQVLNRIIIATLVVAIAGLVWERMTLDVTPADGAITDKSIAVLPFADFSPDGDQAWFADGLTDEILNALSRTRNLRVASRTSSFGFRGFELDVPKIAKELNVGHILEGSVRRAGDRIRVTAQLIRASDDAHLWSETYDASSTDSIEIQEQIAFEIASLLDTALDPVELKKMVAAGTDSISAWESYLRLREIERDSLENQNQSNNAMFLELYEQTVSDDPRFAEAHLSATNMAYAWLNPSDFRSAPNVTKDELRKLFVTASSAAVKHARSEEASLEAEYLRAMMQVRLTDMVSIADRLLESRPNDRNRWFTRIISLVQASRFDEAPFTILATTKIKRSCTCLLPALTLSLGWRWRSGPWKSPHQR